MSKLSLASFLYLIGKMLAEEGVSESAALEILFYGMADGAMLAAAPRPAGSAE